MLPTAHSPPPAPAVPRPRPVQSTCPLWFLLMKGHSTHPETGLLPAGIQRGVSESDDGLFPSPAHPTASSQGKSETKPGPRRAPHPGWALCQVLCWAWQIRDMLVGHDMGQLLDQAGARKEGFLKEARSAQKRQNRQVGARLQWAGKPVNRFEKRDCGGEERKRAIAGGRF